MNTFHKSLILFQHSYLHLWCSERAASFRVSGQFSSVYSLVKTSWKNNGTWSSARWPSFSWISGAYNFIRLYLLYKYNSCCVLLITMIRLSISYNYTSICNFFKQVVAQTDTIFFFLTDRHKENISSFYIFWDYAL